MLSEQLGQRDQFSVAEREPKQRTAFACPSSYLGMSAAGMKAPSVRASARAATPITSPFSTSKLGSGKRNCRGLPHAGEEAAAALRCCSQRLSPSAAGHGQQIRQLAVFRNWLYFPQPLTVACFISLPDLAKGDKAGLGDSAAEG